MRLLRKAEYVRHATRPSEKCNKSSPSCLRCKKQNLCLPLPAAKAFVFYSCRDVRQFYVRVQSHRLWINQRRSRSPSTPITSASQSEHRTFRLSTRWFLRILALVSRNVLDQSYANTYNRQTSKYQTSKSLYNDSRTGLQHGPRPVATYSYIINCIKGSSQRACRWPLPHFRHILIDLLLRRTWYPGPRMIERTSCSPSLKTNPQTL